MIRRLCYILILSGWGLSQLAAMEIRAEVDRNPVALQQSFTLTFSAAGDPDSDPDFSPLKQQFEIINQQRSSQSSWVNGKSQHSQEWHLSLMAKQAGELLIPPIAFGKDFSKPLKLKVNEQVQAIEHSGDLFLEAEINTSKVYQQSQALLSLRLYRRVQMTQASLSEPELANVVLERLGDDASYSTSINGSEYAVTERKYALFPQQAGELVIPPITVDAEILSYQSGRRGFWGQSVTETRRVQSKPIKVRVLPVAAGFDTANWLAAEDLQLTEQWSDVSMQVKAGQPITRTIKLTANGTTVAQLPELSTLGSVPAGLKTYSDQPQLHEEKRRDGLMASREEKTAFIATQAGEYDFPEVIVGWFNTETGQKQFARLPAAKLQVLAASVLAPQASLPEPVRPVSQPPVQINDQIGLWQALSAFLAISWGLTIVYFLNRWDKRPAVSIAEPAKAITPNQYRQALEQACQTSLPEKARSALLGFFAVRTLPEIVDQQPVLADALAELSHTLYAQSPSVWQGDSLWQAFLQCENSQAQLSAAKNTDGLEPFFKLVS